MKINSIAILFMGLFCLTTVVKAQTNEFTIALTDPSKRGKLKVHLNSGSISVKGTARKDILVKYKTKDEEEDNTRTKDGLKRISGGGVDLEGSENLNSVTIRSDSWNNQIDLEIEIPAGFDVQAHTYNDGNLMLTSIQGELALTNYNGEITALNISGSVIATTYNGEIKITFDKVSENVPMSYHTYNGDINVTFPASVKASFKMKTEEGDIYTDFDMKITSTGPKKTEDSKSGIYKVVIDDWKKGDVNGGGAEVTLKTNEGDIYIRKR